MKTLVLGERGEKAAVVLAAVGAILAVSLWITVPTALARARRDEASGELARESASVRRARGELEARAAQLRTRARDAGNLVSRIAFLYGVAASRWPRALSPETGTLASADSERLADGLGRYLAALERGRALLEQEEEADPGLAARTPALFPVASDLVEPSAVFGPRVSPWTGSEEFFTGLDLAAPAGSPVLAPADGTVVFAGRAAASASSRLSRFGNLAILSHGDGGATLFGHLGKLEVRRGQRVRRGDRLGIVGATGWAMSPALHYEVWRKSGGALAPTDPRFAILDRRLTAEDVSLERMAATSAPNAEALPFR